MTVRRRVTSWAQALSQLAADKSGQDLVEYGLLASFIGVAGYLILMALGVDILQTYNAWLDPTTGTPSLWDPPAPAGGGS
jgi:Flp pilus assembly pilin Flp